jgi:hypothetical protein
MADNSNIGPHARFETFLNFVAIYNRSVSKLLSDASLPPGIHHHIGILQLAIAMEALLSRIYLELILPGLPDGSHDNLERLSAEIRWYLAPILFHTVRGQPARYFEKGKMPYQGLVEMIKIRNASAHPQPDFQITGKLERPFISDGEPGEDLPRRIFWDRDEWPLLRIHKHPELVSRSELERAYQLFLSLIDELARLTDNTITFEWVTEITFTLTALVAGANPQVANPFAPKVEGRP